MTDHIKIDRDDRVLTLRIARPEKKNALTHEMYGAIADAIVDAQTNATLGAVVLTGEGDFFTAGNDLVEFQAGLPPGKAPVTRFLEAIRDAEKPLIAAVNGHAVGVGLTLLLHCDLAFAAAPASFRAPFAHLGLVPEAGSSMLLPMSVGMAMANDILLAGRRISAQEALDAGLISRVFDDPASLQQGAAQVAADIAALAPNALKESKAMIRHHRDALIAQMDDEMVRFGRQLRSPEFAEAAQAFMERRAPRFT